jgi:hypothetical protein
VFGGADKYSLEQGSITGDRFLEFAAREKTDGPGRAVLCRFFVADEDYVHEQRLAERVTSGEFTPGPFPPILLSVCASN